MPQDPGFQDVAIDLPPIRVLEFHPGAHDPDTICLPGEAGASALTLTRTEAAALAVRSFLTYFAIATYSTTFLYLKAELEHSRIDQNVVRTDIVFLVYGVALFTFLTFVLIVGFDIRFLLVLARSYSPRSRANPFRHLYPSPCFIIYYAYTRGNGFHPDTRDPALLLVGLTSIICDLPIMLLMTVIFLSSWNGSWSPTWFSFPLSFANTILGFAIMSCAFLTTAADDDVSMGEGGVKLEGDELRAKRLMKLKALEVVHERGYIPQLAAIPEQITSSSL